MAERPLHAVPDPQEPERPAWGSPPEVEVEAGALKPEETDLPAVTFTETVMPPAAMQERIVPAEGEDAPGLPAWLTDPTVARQVVVRAARSGGLRAVQTARQTPKVVGLGTWWAFLGAGRLLGRWLLWAWDKDGHPLVSPTPARDAREYTAMADRRAMRQKVRLSMSLWAVVVVAVALLVADRRAPWVLPAVGLSVVVLLARAGRPAGVRLTAPNPLVQYRPRLTHQGVVAALMALGITPLTKSLEKDATRIWRSDFTPIRGGHKIELQLPASVLSADLVQHEQRIASALVRPQDTVIVEPLPHRTPSDLRLWIFDRPVLAGDRGPGPLAKARKTSWFEPVQIGLTRTGQPFSLDLRGGAQFYGGQPGSGKSTTAQINAAHTALDPRALLVVVNLKGSPDWLWARPIAHRYLSGSPETDPTVIPSAVDLLLWLLDETARRNDYLVRLVERGHATSTDVTPELAAAHDALRPMTVILDEVHRLFDPADNDRRDLAIETLAKVIKACRSVAITFVPITQLAGTESVPPALTRAARVRGCLKVQDEVSWRQIFGTAGRGSFTESGVSTLAKGIVILRTEDGAPTKVGCYHLQSQHLSEIGRRALSTRTDLALLTGEAAGSAETPSAADPAQLLRDVLAAIPSAAPTGGPQDSGAAWLAELEQTLGDGEAYAGRADGWLSSELQTRGVTTEKIGRRWTEDGAQRQRTTVGVRAETVRAALARLMLSEPAGR